MARLIQPRTEPDSSADVLTDTFKRHGFVAEAHALAEICRAVGLDHGDPLDPRGEDLDHVAEHVAHELRKLTPPGAGVELLLVLEIYVLHQAARQGFRNWQPNESTLAAVLDRCIHGRGDMSETVRVAMATVKNGPVQLRPLVAALFSGGHLDPLAFIDVDAVRTTTKRTGGSSWNQAAHDSDPRLPDFWLQLDSARTLEACARMFESEPLETLGALALGLERQIGLQYPGMCIEQGPNHRIGMRELYPHVEPLALVLCRRRAESGSNDRTLTQCCWSYARLAGTRARVLLGELYAPLARLALVELENMRKLLRGSDAETCLREQGDYLTEAVFFGPRTAPDALWPVFRRLALALREMPRRGVPLDLRTWDEHDPSFEKVPRPWNWVADHMARVLELLLACELERDAGLNELRREFAKFCIERVKTREKARADRPLANEDFFEPKPAWRAAYINAAKELHPNLGERGHHALTWSRDHDPDEDVRDAARSAADAIRHGHGLPKNTSPRRAMFAAFWWLRQAHVVSLGEHVDVEGAQRTFRKEMRRQASLEK